MAERHSLVLPFADPPVLELSSGFSEIEVLPVEPGGVPRLEARRDPAEYGITAHLEDGVVRLTLRVGEGGFHFLGPGHSGLTLYVPKNVRARLRNDMGSLVIRDLDGCDLDAAVAAGQMRLSNVHGRLKLHADAGEIRGEALGGTLDVDCNAGSARLSVDWLDAGTHRVFSTMGSVRLELAETIKARVEAKTVMGSTRVRFPNTPDAEVVLKLGTDLGSVKVASRGPWNDVRHGDRADWRRWWADKAWPERPGEPPPEGPPWARWAQVAQNVARSVFQPPAPPPRNPASDEELRRILGMVEQGTLNAADAEKLIRAIEGR